jgi:acyl carrier protein phosphodiesterase
MNYLAHLFLAERTAESLIGNLAGDFVRGPLGDRFPPAIRDGIRHHRAIDAFTDSHPDAGAFRRVLHPRFGHYAPVISDMFFDHFLATNWSDYATESLDEFLNEVFALIDPHVATLPGKLRFIYPRIRDDRWLTSYREVRGIHIALTNMSRRLSRQPDFSAASTYLVTRREELERHFARFFPKLVEHSNAIRSSS